MLQVKNQMGSSFQKFHITSARRSPEEHANTYIRYAVPKDSAHTLYKKEPSQSYYLALQDMYHGRTFNQRSIKNTNDINLIQTIPNGDIEKLIDISIKLMIEGSFIGTDHRYSNAVDIIKTTSSEKLYNKIKPLGYFCYPGGSFFHISFWKKS
ncbi:MAG: hypothetical protein ACRCVW_00455 [Brevinema sp.]